MKELTANIIKQPWLVLIAGLVLVVVASQFGLINDEMQSTLQVIIGGALLIALRSMAQGFQDHIDRKVTPAIQENTQITAETAETAERAVRLIQDNTSLKLEVDLYRSMFNKIRDNPACAECASLIADEMRIARRVETAAQ